MSASDDQPSVDLAVVIAVEDPTSPDAQRCLQAYFDELDRRFDGGFDRPEHPCDRRRPGRARRAVAAGATSARLETNRSLTEAIRLYRSAGYVEVPAFNDEPYAHHWFEKDLSTPPCVLRSATAHREASRTATHRW